MQVCIDVKLLLLHKQEEQLPSTGTAAGWIMGFGKVIRQFYFNVYILDGRRLYCKYFEEITVKTCIKGLRHSTFR